MVFVRGWYPLLTNKKKKEKKENEKYNYSLINLYINSGGLIKCGRWVFCFVLFSKNRRKPSRFNFELYYVEKCTRICRSIRKESNLTEEIQFASKDIIRGWNSHDILYIFYTLVVVVHNNHYRFLYNSFVHFSLLFYTMDVIL